MGSTCIDIADLYFWVSAGPEIDADGGPNRRSEVELELCSVGGDGGGGDSEGIGAYKIEGEALHGWVMEGVPTAMAGTTAKRCWKL
jgi:hypothetical protein